MPDTQNYAQARENMVDCQIHPMGVFDEKILEAFMTVPREEFVPEDKKGVAYIDEDLDIGNDRYLIEPSIVARLIDKAHLSEDDVVLTIGSGAGYTAALLSKLVSTVVSLEEDADLMARAQKVWDEHGFCNIAGIAGNLTGGAPDHAPFSVIIINGCVSEVPDAIKKQLAVGGRLLGVTRKTSTSSAQAIVIEKTGEEAYSDRVLFDASTPYLKGFEPLDGFQF